MAILTIRTFPDSALKGRCEPVAAFDADLHRLLDDMAETMRSEDGIGLAANQVGDLRRLFLMDVPLPPDAQTKEPRSTGLIEVINPVILARRGEVRQEEGCLSFPGVYEQVNRAAEVDLQWCDRHGVVQRATMVGLVAICAQHEGDHLDGITFIDRLSPLKRQLALRAYERSLRESADDRRQRLARMRQRRAARFVG